MPLIHRLLGKWEAELIKQSREATMQAFDILKQNPVPDSFLGRKTHEPFPEGDDQVFPELANLSDDPGE